MENENTTLGEIPNESANIENPENFMIENQEELCNFGFHFPRLKPRKKARLR